MCEKINAQPEINNGLVTAYDFLEIEELPLHNFDKRLLKFACKSARVRVRNKFEASLKFMSIPSEYFYELENQGLNDLINNNVFDEKGNRRQYEEVMKVIIHLNNQNRSTLIANYLATGESIVRMPFSNFIERVVKGKGNCFDISLFTRLIGKMYYPEYAVDIVPYYKDDMFNTSTQSVSNHCAVVFRDMVNGGENNRRGVFFVLDTTIGVPRSFEEIERNRNLWKEPKVRSISSGMRVHRAAIVDEYKRLYGG